MTLSALIRKRDTGNLATSIPAISATQSKGEAATVARIATVAVANPKEEQTAPPSTVRADGILTASRWWRIHYSDRESVVVCILPELTRAEIMEQYPDAVEAQAFIPIIRRPSTAMAAEEVLAIRAWLALIEETAPAIIAHVIEQCHRDADARNYFANRAASELPKPDPIGYGCNTRARAREAD